ncbi:MAG: hypothetical protein JO160_08160, partial [Candidatus Eremiobacteraeota bacterium]|nr:hypothetical protein [Candidatus Eremiobacteraeota bacterium]
DPRDRRYPERLAGSTLASLLLHALFALLFFSILTSSSQEGATENTSGEIVTIERRAPVTVANAPAAPQPAPPVPHAPRIAPIQHAPLVQPQAQRMPQNRHELARIAPTAPPNPRPIPQQTPQPNPQPTQNVYEVQPQNQAPAAPLSVPTVAPIAVAVKPVSSLAPSPAPTSAPSARPSPKPPAPTAVPSARPATPGPVTPSAAPTAAAVAVRASSAPTASPGVPSPSPTSTALAKTPGTAPSPGPKGVGSPGPQAGSGKETKPGPQRPIKIAPTPSPQPRETPSPKPSGIDLNAKLRALLPNNPVNPTSKQYTPSFSLRGRMEPTPPPDVLAKTRYIYRSLRGTERVVMWVTDAHKAGPTTMCTGWLVRYPVDGTPPTSRRQTARRCRSAAEPAADTFPRSSTASSPKRVKGVFSSHSPARPPRRHERPAFPLELRLSSH